MNVDIKGTTENKLFERKEVSAEVSFDNATPKRADIKQGICGKVGANPETVILRQVSSKFGTKRVTVVAHVYQNKEQLMKAEPRYIKVREGLMPKPEKKKKAAAPAAKKK